MTKWITIAIMFTMAAGAALASQLDAFESHAYHDCAAERVAVFGYGSRSAPVAELAAIVRWSEAAENKLGKVYGNWAMAQDRVLSCARWRKTPYSQCKISAAPCTRKHDDKDSDS